MAEKTKLPVRQGNGALRRRRDPMAMLNALQDQMDRFWREPFRFAALHFRTGLRCDPTQTFLPRIDVYEQDNTIVIKADLPGVKREDVQVELDDDGLVIRGQSHAEREMKDDAYCRSERSFGSFYRRLPLPFYAQADQIQASMTDGVLEVRIPRPSQTQMEPKTIPITRPDVHNGPDSKSK